MQSMKNSNTIAIIVITMMLSGCAGLSYGHVNYSGVDSIRYVHDDMLWKILDKPHENRMWIFPLQGPYIAFFLEDPHRDEYQDAAVAWLNSQGRNCKVIDIVSIIAWEREAKYECE